MGKFQNVLKNLRTSCGLTQAELSKSLKISRSTIGMYEKGAREPDFETLELIADFFNVDTDYLLGRTNKTTFIPQSAPTIYDVRCETESECDLVLSYRKLNDRNKEKCSLYTNTLLTNQQMEEDLMPNAAHESTKPYTAEERQEDEDMLD